MLKCDREVSFVDFDASPGGWHVVSGRAPCSLPRPAHVCPPGTALTRPTPAHVTAADSISTVQNERKTEPKRGSRVPRAGRLAGSERCACGLDFARGGTKCFSSLGSHMTFYLVHYSCSTFRIFWCKFLDEKIVLVKIK
jgi:hypothetical protein